MRKVLGFSLILLILLTVLPTITAFIKDDKEKADYNLTTVNKEDNTEEIIEITLELADEDFCDEALKAVMIIVENNIECNSSAYNKEDKSKFSEDFYQRAEKLYTKAELKYMNKRVFVPTSWLSSGFTKEDKDYPYIKSVASPWDCFQKDFVYGKEYAEGVSLKGIDYLCKEGFSAKEALKWYLPEFEIK